MTDKRVQIDTDIGLDTDIDVDIDMYIFTCDSALMYKSFYI